MALFDDLKDRATDVAQVAGKKVGEAYNLTKLRMLIAEKQGAVRSMYKELGEIVYLNSKNDDPDIEAMEDKIAEIDLALDAVGDLKKELRAMKNIAICPNCDAEVNSESNFCPNCGNEM